MQLVPYNQQYKEDVINLWNNEIGDDFPMYDALFEQNFIDQSTLSEATLVAIDNNEVIGFIQTKVKQGETGWIGSLIVSKAYRNDGIGTKLLDSAEKALIEKGVFNIVLGRGPHPFFPGVPLQCSEAIDLFKKRGYQHTDTQHDMYRYYKLDEFLPLPSRDGLSFELLNMNDKQKLVEFVKDNFAHWLNKVETYEGSGREFAVLKKDGEIIAFCRVNDKQTSELDQNVYWADLFEEDLGGLGPLGVSADYRGLGLGRAIVEAGVYFLQQRGIQNVVINWTNKDAFYEKLGYKKWKSYGYFNKQIDNSSETR